MAVIKRRPHVVLRGPRVIPVGRPCTMSVTVQCPRPVEVDGITLELVGTLTAASGDLHGTSSAISRHVATLLAERTKLAAGEHTYDVVVHLHAGTPGSYNGASMTLRWNCRVVVDIPWWPDRRADFSVNVGGQGFIRPAPSKVFVSDMRGPQGQGPYSEVSLASTIIEAGGTIVGHIALSNVATNRYRELRFALAAKETQRGHTALDRPIRWVVPLDAPAENGAVPFRLRLPPTLTPGFVVGRTELRWLLELELDVAWTRNPVQWIPLQVRTEDSGPEVDTIEAAPLAVGSERLQHVWRSAARNTGFSHSDERLVRLIDGATLEIRREHRGRKGIALVAEAALPEVDIGLHVHKGALRCRDEGQSNALAVALESVANGLTLVEASDVRMRWSLDDAGVVVGPLANFARATERFTRAVIDARDELPPPADVAELEQPFARAARMLGGTLQRAGMDVFGVRDELPFSLQTRWDPRGALLCTALTVRPLIAVDARFHGVFPADERPETMLPGLEEVLDHADGFAVESTSIEVYFAAKPADVHAMVDRMERLIAIGLRLSMRSGGYR